MGYAHRRRMREAALARNAALMQRAATDPTFCYFNGNVINFQLTLDNIANNPNSVITEANITVLGNQVHEMNTCCLIITIILGSFFIFPLCFMCCDWWKSMVYPTYEIPVSVYQKLQYILASPNIRVVAMNIHDNNLNGQKAKIIYDSLSRSQIKAFTLLNSVVNINYKDYQWTNFKEYFKPIKMLPIQSTIMWMGQIVQ